MNDDRLPSSRSKLTNAGPGALDVDGRSARARRWRDLFELIVSELPSPISAVDEQLAKRSATLAAICEEQEAGLIEGEEFDLAEFQKCCGLLGRMLRLLGLEEFAAHNGNGRHFVRQRRRRQSDKTLNQYLKGRTRPRKKLNDDLQDRGGDCQDYNGNGE